MVAWSLHLDLFFVGVMGGGFPPGAYSRFPSGVGAVRPNRIVIYQMHTFKYIYRLLSIQYCIQNSVCKIMYSIFCMLYIEFNLNCIHYICVRSAEAL